jgi:hypothetical protein
VSLGVEGWDWPAEEELVGVDGRGWFGDEDLVEVADESDVSLAQENQEIY